MSAAVWLAVIVLIAGCTSETDSLDPASASTCDELVDIYLAASQNILDGVGSRTVEEMRPPPAEVQADIDIWFEIYWEVLPSRSAELCGEGKFETLLCARQSDIEAFGPAGENLLQSNFPFLVRCDL